ncbi:MAG: hypothetical protein LBI04_08635 [Treponema sp.]|jgi:hypothetical protein|nr:hypothetical protein [Treponema sp.]
MKCSYCGKNVKDDKYLFMRVDGEPIAIYCSSNCRSKAVGRMIELLEESGREKNEGGYHAKPKITHGNNPPRKKTARS